MTEERETRSALLVDDDPSVCAVIARHLRREGFDVTCALDEDEARTQLSAHGFDLLVCDLRLGPESGLEVAREVRTGRPDTAIVMISGEGSPDVASTALAADVDEYLVKPFGGEQLAIAVASAFRRRDEQTVTQERVAETKALVARDATEPGGADETLDRLARAGRFRDEETAEHVERMSRTCALVGRTLGMSPAECVELRTAAALHDLGKVGVPDAILRKRGRLNAAERELIERHPEIGHGILAGSSDPMMKLAATIALTHHEHVDGNGYPRGLKGDEIPLPGRIAAVADVFDALTHDRVYRPAFPVPEAMEVMRNGRGAQFDPRVFDAFEQLLPEIEELGRRYPDSGAPDTSPPVEQSAPVRALIVDDHDALARGIEILLRREGFEIAGIANSAAAARRILERRPVDVAVIDVSLGEDSGLDLVPDAKSHGARALVYTGFVDAATVAEARKAGADGVAAKAGSPGELAEAIREVARGESHFDPRLNRAGAAEAEGPRLTKREREIVDLLAEGLSGEEIAERLFISPETVRTHIRNAMERAGARTRAHLIALATPAAGRQAAARGNT